MPMPSSHSTPGSLDLNPSKKAALYEAIQKALALKQKIKIFLDFDDTMIFIKQVTASTKATESSYVNMHLINFLVELFSDFGVEAFKLEILSARLADEHIPSTSEHIKIQRLLPYFLSELNKRLTKHKILPEQIQSHCLMEQQLYIYKKVLTQNVNGKKMHFEEILPDAVLFHERELRNPYGEARIKKMFEFHLENLTRQHPHTPIIKARAELTKANYLVYFLGVRSAEQQKSTLHIHIDDNEYELQKIQDLNCVHIVKIIPQPQSNRNQVTPPNVTPLPNITEHAGLTHPPERKPTPDLTRWSYFDGLENHSLFTSRQRFSELVKIAASDLQKQRPIPRDARAPHSKSISNPLRRPITPMPTTTKDNNSVQRQARIPAILDEVKMTNPLDRLPPRNSVLHY